MEYFLREIAICNRILNCWRNEHISKSYVKKTSIICSIKLLHSFGQIKFILTEEKKKQKRIKLTLGGVER